MTKKLFLSIFVLITSVVLTPLESYASDDLESVEHLTAPQVRTIMSELLSYHVDEHEMTSEILARSLKIYFEQFDPLCIYFLEDEVSPYLNPRKSLLAQMLDAYGNDDIRYYDQASDIIRQSIIRSRMWRKEFENNRDQLFRDYRSYVPSAEDFDGTQQYVKDTRSLKERLRGKLLGFIGYQVGTLKREPTKEEEKKILALFERSQRSYEEPYLIDERDKHEHVVVVSALKALASSLDGHTAFFSPEEAYEMRVRLEKGVQGIGVVLQDGLDGITISRLIEGGPAERSKKVALGDRVVQVEGLNVDDMAFRDVLKIVRGKQNTEVKLGLVHKEGNGDEKFIEVRLRRERIMVDEDRVDSNYHAFGDGIIGTLTLHSFYESSSGSISSEKDIRDALMDLKRKGNLKGVVLDLRDNRGGFLMQAVKVAGLFITNGVIAVSKYSNGEMSYLRDIDGYTYYDGPLVILTSKESASAAEIVAQALQDYGAALIVGDERTYGKGSIQHQTVTESGKASAFFKVTVGRYYTASGKSTQIDGVKADIVVPGFLSHEKIGEEFLDYPLAKDATFPVFIDPLSDIGNDAKQWFWSYYMPTLEKKDDTWRRMLPWLKKNSEQRIGNNKNYVAFKKVIERDFVDGENVNYGLEDLQMQEAVEIVRDMVQLASEDKIAELGINISSLKKMNEK